MCDYYIENNVIYKVYQKANHVYRIDLKFLSNSPLKELFKIFSATDLDFAFLQKNRNLIKITEKECLDLITK